MWGCAGPRRRRRSWASRGSWCCPRPANPKRLLADVNSRRPVLLVHGAQDELIPPQALFQATQGLAALGVPVEWHLSAGIGHGIDAEGLRHGGEFLARGFGLSR